ncbi:MAG: polysaccharide deacetylase family protein [Rhodovarius sp.]|nr:polysaccharide deacetylase family protein [Rhodovarius sp.]
MIRRRALAGLLAPALALPGLARAARGTLYLTIDTGWSREAETIAEAMRARGVVATLFLANELTYRGDRQLEPSWAPFWRARAAEGHVFASHTWRHWYFTGDLAPGRTRYASRRPGEGAEVLDQAGLCAELLRPLQALQAMVPEARILPLWRAPGGILTPQARRMAQACGLRHQGWSAHGFLGDELDSDSHPNDLLLRRALSRIRDGEVLMMHWGVRRRREPFALVFGALLDGLIARGFRFAPLPPEGV